jgi:hypothetical protein
MECQFSVLKIEFSGRSSEDTMEPIEEGRFFLETVWLKIAMEVIETAIRVYELDEEKAAALREVFCQPSLYSVVLD